MKQKFRSTSVEIQNTNKNQANKYNEKKKERKRNTMFNGV